MGMIIRKLYDEYSAHVIWILLRLPYFLQSIERIKLIFLITYRRAITTRRAVFTDSTTVVAVGVVTTAGVVGVAASVVAAVLTNDIVKCHIESAKITHF